MNRPRFLTTLGLGCSLFTSARPLNARRFGAGIATIMAVGVLTISVTRADDAPPSSNPTSPAAQSAAPPGDDIPGLIKELDADAFAQRQAASLKLNALGEKAVPALIEAAKGESREASQRAIEVLKNHLESKDEALQKTARKALEDLSAGDNARTARLAKDALKPAVPNVATNPAIVPGAVPIRVMAGGIRIAAGAPGGVGRRVTIQNANGQKTITVEEANRKIKIEDAGPGGIKMEITETKDGKETTRKVEAKDADDLKKKDPDAHKIFEEFKQQGNAIQIQIGAMPGLPGAAPGAAPGIIPPPPGALPNAVPRARLPINLPNARDGVDRAQKQLDELKGKIEKMLEKPGAPDDLKKVIEEIETAKKSLEDARQSLGGR